MENNQLVIVHPDCRLEIQRILLLCKGQLSQHKKILQQQQLQALAS